MGNERKKTFEESIAAYDIKTKYNFAKDKCAETFESDLEKLASRSSRPVNFIKQAAMVTPTKEEREQENEEIDNEDSFQEDIDCEVCDYKGKPTHDGLCPSCGAINGKEASNYLDDEVVSKNTVNIDPAAGLSLYEADEMGKLEE